MKIIGSKIQFLPLSHTRLCSNHNLHKVCRKLQFSSCNTFKCNFSLISHHHQFSWLLFIFLILVLFIFSLLLCLSWINCLFIEVDDETYILETELGLQ